MNLKRHLLLLSAGILGTSLLIISFFNLSPFNILSIQEKPEASTKKAYDYYLILDEADGHSLMYVPLVVNIGDEVLSEDNKLYRVVKVEENRAYARFIENKSLEKYKKK